MKNGLSVIVVEAGNMARKLPLTFVQMLANSIGACDTDDWPASKSRIIQNISHPNYRTFAANFLDRWRNEVPDMSPQSVCAALLAAAEVEKSHREDQSVEIVWTGPEAGLIPLRRTEQALLQLISSAAKRIVIVSYAVYNIPRIREALVNAADRDVKITIIIETPDLIEGQSAYSTLKALGPSVANCCDVYLWPLEKREKDANGKPGILHVKCAVADGRRLFLSSANLTEYAFTLNMELGLLITGGAIPKQVENHFYQMIDGGVFASL
ncbi:MAG TPA: DISARM system phospholipase D-like protein DrmC [Blastocatellia bacterium]|nr:DISARM system phospholipase D-like protein DrmC [Blastocatellia bacterium]